MIELYRYETQDNKKTVELVLRKFYVVRETECGYWYIPDHMKGYDQVLPEYFKKSQRWVSKTSRKRRCYPTKEDALKSFQIRAAWRLRHLRRQMMIAEIGESLTAEGERFTKPEEYHWVCE